MLNRLKKNDKKGFTLVELIVVLVILAILAALLIPALTGYIDKAKEKQIIAETRQAVMAAQTLVDEEYAKTGKNLADNDATFIANTKKLAEVGGTIKTLKVSKGIVIEVTYENAGKACKYTNDADNPNPQYNPNETPSTP